MFRDPTMRQLRWGLKAEFPYTKVFILGILLTVLGSACVVVSVVGIVQLAWGYYVSTGMWGGVTVTVSGLAAMYAARAQSSISARLYFFLSIVTCVISFAMVVLSAGGLTYRSRFYQPVRFDISKHKVTLFLHGSVLGVGVLSLACNLLSVIVCCKFITREKGRGEETFKLRRYRHRFSDVSAVYRSGSLRGTHSTGRTSTNSRTPLFGSDRSRKHSRQASETDSTNLKIPSERSSNRRDSDRSKGSSRSRHSHHRQSSSLSQQSRQSAPMDAEVTTVLLRDTDHNHREITSSHSTIDNARDSQAETLTDNMSVQLVFDPDEEPPPPYEEARPVTFISSDGNESETEAVDGSSSIVIPSCLPLNIPVTRIGGCQVQSLQSQPPPMEPSPTQVCDHPQQISEQGSSEVAGALIRTISEPNSPDASGTERDNRINMMRMTLADQWPNAASSASNPAALQDRESSDVIHSEDGSASPEICALTGERMTPVAAVQPDTVPASDSATLAACVSKHNPSPDSSDTSIPGELVKTSHNPAPSHTPSGTAHAVSSESSSALPAGIHSPSSAFRPVGKRIVPLAHASPSNSVPLHNVFSPISSPGTAHHTIYSPIASPSSAARFASPTSPHRTNNMASSSSESLTRGGCVQSLSWKKIPLPPSHNHSNRTSSVPFKEVTSKTIPGPSQPPPRDRDTLPHSLPKRASKDKERGFSKNSDNRVAPARIQSSGDGPEAEVLQKHSSKFSSPKHQPPQKAQPASDQPSGPRPSEESQSADHSGRSAFVSKQPGISGRPPISASNFPPPPAGKQVPVSVVSSHPAAGKQVPVSIVDSAGRNNYSDRNNSHTSNARGHSNKGASQAVRGMGNSSAAVVSFPPAAGQPGTVGSQHAPPTSKQSAVLASPSKVARNQVAGLDTSCRSMGCQATDDGGIASSMDRTHRWVMGTLPSGTRFQGTTKNTALIHGGSRNSTLTHGSRNNPLIHAASRNPPLVQAGNRNAGYPQGSTRNTAVTQSPTRNPALAVASSPERSSLLAPVARHGSGGRSHGVWSRPSKAALATSVSGEAAAAAASPSVSSSFSSPTVIASQSSSSVITSVSSPLVNTSPSSPSVSASLSTSSANTSEPAPMQPSGPVDVGPQPVPQRGPVSSRLPRYYQVAEGQARFQPLQPVPALQPQRQVPQPQHQPQAELQHQQFIQQLGEEQDLDQQQGKPLFSVLL
ncbi:uncharacterized protein LOC143282116 [Babylonia areolata]|uniref:uncharacterized protein LOC143282116 n=1 Tax=Babylonia areolata TaxID=304850 RepID=UPI003FCF3E89